MNHRVDTSKTSYSCLKYPPNWGELLLLLIFTNYLGSNILFFCSSFLFAGLVLNNRMEENHCHTILKVSWLFFSFPFLSYLSNRLMCLCLAFYFFFRFYNSVDFIAIFCSLIKSERFVFSCISLFSHIVLLISISWYGTCFTIELNPIRHTNESNCLFFYLYVIWFILKCTR